MAENIVIVESPAKAKTIEKILGSDFLVKSSFGHVRDLPKKGTGIDVDNNFTPEYEVSPDKVKVVAELKKLVASSKNVWLASDEDREGEAISWHLCQVLGLDVASTKRIVFHEITKNAIHKAIENPRTLNIDLVNAQQARRVLDRLVGFELSPVLWRKVRPQLSAGRVQSVAVRLVVEKEREIINFKETVYFRTLAHFTVTDAKGKLYKFKAELSTRHSSIEEAEKFLKQCIGANYSVASIEKRAGKRTPAAPFTTSSLQIEASRKLGFSVSQTMSVAQRLYEAGHITYMRTDSVNLSQDAIKDISSAIVSSFGEQYLQNRNYKTKSKGAQEAHEAIRPSVVANREIDAPSQEKRLYELIWKRSVASQMKDAAIERTTISIDISSVSDSKFVAKGEIITFDGFMKLYTESRGDDEGDEQRGDILPPIEKGEQLTLLDIESCERVHQRPARYSEASLVKQLEELGIGRPSTYAPTISTIISRGYVIKEDREGVAKNYNVLTLSDGKISHSITTEKHGSEKARLSPTDTGMLVNDYLEEHFPQILNFNFTADIEKYFDDIAEGSLNWVEMLRSFYAPFHKSVEDANGDSNFASASARLLGVDSESGKNIYARMGRFGAMVQIGENEDENRRFAGLKTGQLIESITLTEALELFKMPRDLGVYEDKKVVIGIGRFGPYVRHDSKFTSLEKSDDPHTIELERAIELIEAKREKDRNKILRIFEQDDKLQIINGRWGAYIEYDGGNYKLPKGSEPTIMSYEEFMTIVQNSEPTSRKRGAKTAAGSKTTAAKKVTKTKTTSAKAKKSTTTKSKATTTKAATTTRAKKEVK